MQGLPMTTRGPAFGSYLKTAAEMSNQRPCSLTSDQDLAARAGGIVKPLRDVHDRALKTGQFEARVSVYMFASGLLSLPG